MKSIGNYVFPVLLTIIGALLLIVGFSTGQNAWVKLGAFLALLTGVTALLLQAGMIGRKAGTAIGIASALLALFLAFRDYRSVAEVIEFNERKEAYDDKVIQALKDIRTAEVGYRQATGVYTGSLEVLRSFVQGGSIPMVRAIGQIPDSLTEKEALALKIIVRDTIQAPALDSLFRTAKALEKRAYPFDPAAFINSPVTGKPFLLRAGAIQSSGRSVPVFLCKDPSPMVAGDTLMVGSLEKASTNGNWKGD
jgi:hypothetical protein